MTFAVLSYHKIGAEPPPGDWQSWYYVPEDLFAEQLSWFAADGWTVVGIDELRTALDDPAAVPERSLLLTFDDGYASFVRTALPVLQSFGYPAVLFMPTDHVGGTNSWDWGREPDEPLCDWDALAHVHAAGIAVQPHGASHRSMSELSPLEWHEELERAKECLEDRLQAPADVIAYPYGDDAGMPPGLRSVLEQTGYRAAFLYGGGPNPVPFSDPYRLSRLALGPDSDLAALVRGAPVV